MIYLIDTTQYKVIFDKDNTLQAYAIDVEQQAQLKEWQVATLQGIEDHNDKELTVYAFNKTDQKVDDKETSAIDSSKPTALALKQVFWKVIFEEKQEEGLKYVEIF